MAEWAVLVWEVVLVAMLIFAYPVGCFVVAVACVSSRRRRDRALEAAVLRLTWDAGRGRYCHAETGPVIIPDGYGVVVTAEGM